MATEKDPYKGTPMEGESADEIFIGRLLQIARGGGLLWNKPCSS